MKWGLIARAETDRGLGIQTLEMYRHLKPDATLLVEVNAGFTTTPGNYPDAVHVKHRVEHGLGRLDEQTVRDWWSGLDVVITVETLYDWRLVEWAKADNVRTIVHGNPEFWMATNPQPDTWWWPTPWRLNHLPDGPVVPVPVPVSPVSAAEPSNKPRFMHIAGNAMADRNGTNIVLNAMRQTRTASLKMTVFHQSPVAPSSRVTFVRNVADRWSLYDGQHALVLPRRYGGLCLPVLEAMASGLAIIMSDCSPNTIWPIIPLSSDLSRTVLMQTGNVETYDVPHNLVANMMAHYAHNPEILGQAQQRSRQFAADNGWDSLAATYYEHLDSSCR